MHENYKIYHHACQGKEPTYPHALSNNQSKQPIDNHHSNPNPHACKEIPISQPFNLHRPHAS